MRIAVIGATGKTGTEVIKLALAQGHDVSVLVRDPARLALQPAALMIHTGSLEDESALAACVEGCDAVVCALGTKDLYRNSRVRSRGTIALMKAMKHSAISRLVIVSAMGIGESWKSLSLVNRLFLALLMPAAREDHEEQEAAVKASGLDWTILRPSGLTDGPSTATYDMGPAIKVLSSTISRADLAHAVFRCLGDGATIGKALTVSS